MEGGSVRRATGRGGGGPTLYRRRLRRLFPLCFALSAAVQLGIWNYSGLWRGRSGNAGAGPRPALVIAIAPAFTSDPAPPRFEKDMPKEPGLREFAAALPPPGREPGLPNERAPGAPSALAGMEAA